MYGAASLAPLAAQKYIERIIIKANTQASTNHPHERQAAMIASPFSHLPVMSALVLRTILKICAAAPPNRKIGPRIIQRTFATLLMIVWLCG